MLLWAMSRERRTFGYSWTVTILGQQEYISWLHPDDYVKAFFNGFNKITKVIEQWYGMQTLHNSPHWSQKCNQYYLIQVYMCSYSYTSRRALHNQCHVLIARTKQKIAKRYSCMVILGYIKYLVMNWSTISSAQQNGLTFHKSCFLANNGNAPGSNKSQNSNSTEYQRWEWRHPLSRKQPTTEGLKSYFQHSMNQLSIL